eukprot:TRINITY_DN69194_c0_g1_i1.p1 TRINITY_DN69194_c0_g1~~TRINITY_DN69194_c0_g1_i1.p1  ORF type:complete len:355 (+),score=56.29 TRINITY_DN69194_c0_g1_i1:36-1067(+)
MQPLQHSDRCVSSLVICEGDQLVSASQDNTIKIWSVATGDCLRTLTGHADAVNCIALSPTVPWLLYSASDDKTIRAWDLREGAELSRFTGRDAVNVILVQDRFLFTASDDGSIAAWDTESRVQIRQYEGHEDWVTGLLFHHGRLISCSDDGTIRVWETDTGACLQVIGRDGPITGQTEEFPEEMPEGGEDTTTTTVNIADIVDALDREDDGDEGFEENNPGDEGDEDGPAPTCIAVLPSADLLIAGWGCSLILFDIRTGAVRHQLQRAHRDHIRMIVIDEAQRQVITCSDDHDIRVWQEQGGHLGHVRTLTGHNDCVFSLAYDPVHRVLFSGCDGGTIRRWVL